MKIYMKRMFSIFLSIVFLFAATSCAHASKKCSGDLISKKFMGKTGGINVISMKYLSDGLKVNGLLFLPDSPKPLPCVIFNHDGISGISKEHKLSSIRLARAGYAVFSPSYRGEDKSGGKVEIAKGEVNDVINAVKLMSKVKQVDGGRIALAGASHGALISVLAASRLDNVKALVSAYGVMDIYKWWDYLKRNNKIGHDQITKQTYGSGPEDRPQSFAIRNAMSFACRITCPVLILQGAKDDIVPCEQAGFFKNELDSRGIPNIMKIYPDCLHGFLVYAPYIKNADKNEKMQTEQAWIEMISFLDSNLKKRQGKTCMLKE